VRVKDLAEILEWCRPVVHLSVVVFVALDLDLDVALDLALAIAPGLSHELETVVVLFQPTPLLLSGHEGKTLVESPPAGLIQFGTTIMLEIGAGVARCGAWHLGGWKSQDDTDPLLPFPLFQEGR
jgi:hypothetical protein